jgi:multiple sugar transport system ATP-binding protein
LRIIAGLEHVSAGRIFIGDEDVTAVPPRARDIAMVFQDYALYPQMTVKDNLGFGLKLRRVPREARERRVGDVARTLGLDTLLERKRRRSPEASASGSRWAVRWCGIPRRS